LLRQSPYRADEISYVTRPVNSDGSLRHYYSGSPLGGYAEYNFDVEKEGNYDLFGFGAPGAVNPGGMDSFFVKINDLKMEWSTNTTPEYRWMKINSNPVPLKSGSNKITLLLREPEAKAARLALFPSGEKIPDLNKSGEKGLIMIDASKPDKIEKDFIIAKECAGIDIPEGFMLLKELLPESEIKIDQFPGEPLPHYMFQESVKGNGASFLNFFYPGKPGMAIPDFTRVSENIYLIKWENCVDIIAVKKGDSDFVYDKISSDADMLVLRKKRDSVSSFVMVNGSYIKTDKSKIIELQGGRGIACWSDGELAVSGKNVYNFLFNSPGVSLKEFFVDGERKELLKTEKGWTSLKPFSSKSVLTWNGSAEKE